MSRLNLDHLSGLLSIELVTATVGPPGSPSVRRDMLRTPLRWDGRAGSFEQHLEQAGQTAHSKADTGRPALAEGRLESAGRRPGGDSPPVAESDHDSSPGTRPGSTEEHRSTTTETRSDDDQDRGVFDADHTSGEEDENDDEAPAADSTQSADASAVDHPGSSSNHDPILGDPLPADEIAAAGQGQGQAGKPTQAKDPSGPTGELLPGGPEEPGLPGAESASPENITAGSEANGEGANQAREEKNSTLQVAGGPRESRESTGAGQEADAESSNISEPAGPELSQPSAQSQGSAAHSRGQDGRQGEDRSPADHPSDTPLAVQAKDAELASTQPGTGMGPPPGAAGETRTEAGDATAASTAAGRSENEVAAPRQASSSQPARQASPTPDRETSAPDQADRVRFVQRVARAFQAAGDRGGSVRLRLHPPELGSLRLEVNVRSGTMNARLEVETTTARTMLLDNLPALRDRLAEQDIKVGRFDVDLAGRSADGSPRQPADHPQSHNHPHGNAPNTGTDQDAERERLWPPGAVSHSGEGKRLDVTI